MRRFNRQLVLLEELSSWPLFVAVTATHVGFGDIDHVLGAHGAHDHLA
jgi:hypothetical protein